MAETTLAEVFARELARTSPELTTPEIAAQTSAALAIGTHALRDGRLVPSKREAIAQAAFLPRKFVHAIAREAAESAPTPMARSLAYFEGIGTTLDSALGLDTGMGADVAEAVRGEVDRMEAGWVRTAERLGLDVQTVKDAL